MTSRASLPSTRRSPPSRAIATRPAAPWPAPDAAKHSKLPASEPEGTKFVVDQIKSASGTCKGIITPFAVNGFEDELATKRSDTLVKALPKGLVECDCKIPDADAFEAGAAEWFGEWAPPLAWIDMPTIAKGEKKPVGKLVK